MPDLQKTQQKYKKTYKQLVDGFSTTVQDKKTIYVKHLSESDIGELELSTDRYIKESKKRGLPDEEEKIKMLIKQEMWSNKNEEKIINLRKELSILQDTHKKLFLKGQIAKSKKQIDKLLKELTELLTEKNELLGLTCEKYAEKKTNEEIVLFSFFRDKALSERFFTDEEYDELHKEKLYYNIQVYNDIAKEFSVEEMKKLAALPFFINLFFLCEDNIYNFYGKSITELSICQIEAFNAAKTYKSIMGQGNSPPDEMYEDLDKLVSFYDSYSSGSTESLKEAKSKDSQSIVGATIEEMKKMTKGNDGGEIVTTLKQEQERLRKEGRGLEDLSLEEIAKMHQ